MTPPIHYPTFNSDELRASSDELLDGLWIAYKHTSDFFMANPRTESWRAFVRAHAAWKVAFLAEEGRS